MSSEVCPANERLKAFALGQIGEGDAEPILEHLNRCSNCAETIDQLSEATDQVLAGVRQPALPGRYEADSNFRNVLNRVKEIANYPSFSAERRSSIGDLAEGAPPQPAPLRQLRDYQLLEKLGEGGMGAVYKARHERLDKIVAIKVLPAERMQDAAAVARFQREMRAVGHLEHPNIVRAMDAGEVDGM
ncbi:MAG: protein kinase, partial [Pirellulales bacterium]